MDFAGRNDQGGDEEDKYVAEDILTWRARADPLH